MYRRSVCAAARELDCDLVLEDKARPQHRWKSSRGKAGKKMEYLIVSDLVMLII